MSANPKTTDTFALALKNADALLASGDDTRALIAYTEAERLARPGDDVAALYAGTAHALRNLGDVQPALALLNQSIARFPGHGGLRFQRALILLALRHYAEGWKDYELRQLGASSAYYARGLNFPTWQGESLVGKSIVVWSEQGFGDEIMFASCLPDLLALGARVTWICTPDVAALARRSFPSIRVEGAAMGYTPDCLIDARFDYQSPLASLPRWLRNSLLEFPRLPYLAPDYRQARKIRVGLLYEHPARRLIGVSWRGGVSATRENARSFSVDRLAPLFRLPNTAFVSLQHRIPPEDLKRCASQFGYPHHFEDAFRSLSATADTVAACDLIVTACNTNVHLAGAMGKRVLCLAPYVPEWRYGVSGTFMDWYPNVKIFRQPKYGDWDSVISRVAALIAAGCE